MCQIRATKRAYKDQSQILARSLDLMKIIAPVEITLFIKAYSCICLPYTTLTVSVSTSVCPVAQFVDKLPSGSTA
jgi:hypothetical protein